MKYPTPERVFFKCSALFVLLTLQIKYQGQTDHDTTFEDSQQLNSQINTSTILLTGQALSSSVYHIHDWHKF